MKKITEEFVDEEQLFRRLLDLAEEFGCAWSYSVLPFSHTVTFYGVDSPSRMPDWLMDLSRNCIAYKGKLQAFTDAAMRREHNRTVGRD